MSKSHGDIIHKQCNPDATVYHNKRNTVRDDCISKINDAKRQFRSGILEWSMML